MYTSTNARLHRLLSVGFIRKSILLLFMFFIVLTGFAQVNTGGTKNKSDHNKQMIGYITNWDAWKDTKAGVPAQGALTHLNIDYSKYTILNYSFFGVAKDGSLHSGDHRNKQIYKEGVSQEPADIFFTDVYSSWDLHILFGELENVNYINEDIKLRAEAQGFEVTVGASTWTHPGWGLSGPLPLPLKKEGGAPGLLDLAHQNNVKVMASLGGWSMCKHFPEMAADPVKRAKFIADCKKLIDSGFDGIDLDWEYPGPYAGMNFTGSEADFQNFTTLVQEIRTAIGPDKLITAAFSASSQKIQGLEWGQLSQTMDYFNFMTYDFNGGWSNIAGHNAPLYPYDGAEAPEFNWKSTLDALKLLGVPMNKICFGLPFYGRGVVTQGAAALNGATNKRQETVQPDGPITTCADYTNWPKEVYDGTPNYFFIKQKALGANSGWTRHWDDQAKVPYLTNGNYFLSYDDEESIEHKANFINDNGLAGAIVWTVYGDLEFSGSATNFGTKLKRWSSVDSKLINKTNEVFAQGSVGLPQVTLTAPVHNAQFNPGSDITLTATASDANGSITKVEFFNGSLKLGEDATAPYSFVWPAVAEGSYALSAKATDNENNVANSNVSNITVGTDVLPTVSITSPANGATFDEGAVIAITAEGTATGASISKIGFYQGNTLLGEDTSAPYAYAWNTALAGNYDLTAVVTDSKGQTATSAVVAVVVSPASGGCDGIEPWDPEKVYAAGGTIVSHKGRKYQNGWWTQGEEPGTTGEWGVWTDIGPCPGGGNIPPTVSISSPSQNQNFDLGTAVPIAVNASDSDGTVTSVAVYEGNNLLATLTAAPYSYVWNNATVGNYSLTAVATDDKNATTTSMAVVIAIVDGSNAAPVVTLTSPSNNAQFTEGDVINLSATATDTDGSISSVDFYQGSVLLGTDNAAPYEWTWSNAAIGTYALTAVATDNAGATGTSSVTNMEVKEATTGGCTSPQYVAGTTYATGADVQNNGKEYNCKEGGWCSSSAAWAYEPGAGMYWQDAWTLVGDCGPGGDPKLPSVAITSPSEGQVFNAGQNILITADASDADGSITKVVFYDGSVLLGEDLTNPYSHTIANPSVGVHALTAVAFDNENQSTTSSVVNASVSSSPPGNPGLPGKILVGYWHNWQNNSAPYIRLNQVSDNYDVVNVSFAVPRSFSDMTMVFNPEEVTVATFKSDMAALKSKGKKVLISIGGANDPVELKTTADRDKFVSSMIGIITEYGFDGFDIDLEGSSVSLDPGDTDFKNPTTVKINNLITATREIVNHFGSDFILTMAPETFYVQAGFDSYGNGAGAYLPVIYALRDRMTYIHVQHYNTGSMYGADNKIYQPATADFHVAMADMLLTGFPIARNENNRFPALRADQVAFGVPASTGAASSGYTSNADVQKAMNYLINGVSFGGTYVLSNASGYANFRGLMTWSINWDAATGLSFSNAHAAFLHGGSAAGVTSSLATNVSTPLPSVNNYLVYPNPMSGEVSIDFELSYEGKTEIIVMNQLGEVVQNVSSGYLRKGRHKFFVNSQQFPQGIYLFRITTDQSTETVKMLKH